MAVYVLPCVSVTEDGVSPGTKSKATRIASPGSVLAEKETARELALDDAALAASCTKAIDCEVADAMVSVSVAVPVPVEFVALSVTVNVPETVEVPEIRPVEALTVKPEGNPVAPKLVGEFDAVIW